MSLRPVRVYKSHGNQILVLVHAGVFAKDKWTIECRDIDWSPQIDDLKPFPEKSIYLRGRDMTVDELYCARHGLIDVSLWNRLVFFIAVFDYTRLTTTNGLLSN
jgi:hypothetical protein